MFNNVAEVGSRVQWTHRGEVWHGVVMQVGGRTPLDVEVLGHERGEAISGRVIVRWTVAPGETYLGTIEPSELEV
jgi:hypothetical protein